MMKLDFMSQTGSKHSIKGYIIHVDWKIMFCLWSFIVCIGTMYRRVLSGIPSFF